MLVITIENNEFREGEKEREITQMKPSRERQNPQKCQNQVSGSNVSEGFSNKRIEIRRSVTFNSAP